MPGSSILSSAMQRQWTPAAQLSMDALKSAGQVAGSMDKASTVTTTRSAPKGPSGIGGMLGTGAGVLAAAMIPGMAPFGAALAAGGGVVGGGIDGAINGNVGAGLGQGLMTGGMTAMMAPGLFDAKDWAGLLKDTPGATAAAAEGAAAGAAAAVPAAADTGAQIMETIGSPEYLASLENAGIPAGTPLNHTLASQTWALPKNMAAIAGVIR